MRGFPGVQKQIALVLGREQCTRRVEGPGGFSLGEPEGLLLLPPPKQRKKES